MVRRQVQLREEQWEALRQLAVVYGVSISELIRRSIDAWLQQQAYIPVDRRRRALEAIGRFRSGRNDVAKKHDEYFVASILEEAA